MFLLPYVENILRRGHRIEFMKRWAVMVSNAKGNSLFAGASRAAARAMLLSIVCHKGVELEKKEGP